MRATLIHNPTAGDERPTAADLKRILSNAGFQVRYQSTKKSWKKALQAEADLIVVAGGDGTVAEVLLEAAGQGVPVALLPFGTANNISRTLGINGDARELVASWKRLKPKAFDIGVIDDGRRARHFVEAAGGGLFAAAIRHGLKVETAASLVGNETDRALAMLRKLMEDLEPVSWSVQIDGRDLSGDYLAVEAMNIRHAGPSITIAPQANPGDGLLDVVLVREQDRDPLLRYLDDRLRQRDVDLPRTTVRRGREVRLAATGVPVRIDDEGHQPKQMSWRISLRHDAVQVLRAGRVSSRRGRSR